MVSTSVVEGNWQFIGFKPRTLIQGIPKPGVATTELPAPVVGLGSLSGFECHLFQDPLRVSLSGN